MLSKWYPPARFFFMPMYRRLRRVYGSKKGAFTTVMAISGILHVLLFLLLGLLFDKDPLPSLIFTVIAFGILTIVAAWKVK